MPRATRAVLVLAALVAMLGSGQVPPAIAGLVAAVALVLLRVVGVAQAYRSVSWQTVVLVGALIPLSTAIQTSGAADRVASRAHRRGGQQAVPTSCSPRSSS